MSDEAIAYFKKAVIKYNKGNIEELLEKQIECAGTYLALVCNGIDMAGGICYGFNERVGVRSKRFMVDHMNIKEKIADILYVFVRCGSTHEGMPKIGIRYGLESERLKPGVILYKGEENNTLILNVTELVYSYLKAIERIAQNPAMYARYVPPDPEDTAVDRFVDALNSVPNEIYELCEEAQNRDNEELEKRFSRGEIEVFPSSSAYFADDVMNISLELD